MRRLLRVAPALLLLAFLPFMHLHAEEEAEPSVQTVAGIGSPGKQDVADSLNHSIRSISPDGLVATLAGAGLPGSAMPGQPELFTFPADVFVHEDRLYIADAGNNKIRVMPLSIEAQEIMEQEANKENDEND